MNLPPFAIGPAFGMGRCSAVLALSLLCAVSACSRKPADEAAPAATPPLAMDQAPSAAEQAPPPAESAPAATGTIADLGGPEWRLESFDAGEPVPADVQITLAVDGEKLSGRGGCNRYMGSIKNGDAPGAIAIGPLASTKMACAPPADAAETRYVGAMQQARSFVMQDGKLMINYPDGDATRTLTYVR